MAWTCRWQDLALGASCSGSRATRAMGRRADLGRFYAVLHTVEAVLGGRRTLAGCDGRMAWPERGVYFLFEPGEFRSDTGLGPRIVRVGTHGLKAGSLTSLWNRLSQHRGVAS